MPWREVSIMEERREFVRLALQEGANRRELCRRFGVSADVGYKWLARWAAGERARRAIVASRALTPLVRSAQLVDIIAAATPAAVQRNGHPAKRVFQALRIEVNQELSVLERAIPEAIEALEVGGRMVVLAYQSLEDRIVKRALAAASSSTAPAGLPVELPEHRPELTLLVRGAEMASEEEKAQNPRATPVRLRAAERVRRAA